MKLMKHKQRIGHGSHNFWPGTDADSNTDTETDRDRDADTDIDTSGGVRHVRPTAVEEPFMWQLLLRTRRIFMVYQFVKYEGRGVRGRRRGNSRLSAAETGSCRGATCCCRRLEGVADSINSLARIAGPYQGAPL